MESGPEALAGFKCWREAVNSLCENMSEICIESSVAAFQKSDTFWETSQEDLWSTASYFPSLTS